MNYNILKGGISCQCVYWGSMFLSLQLLAMNVCEGEVNAECVTILLPNYIIRCYECVWEGEVNA